MAGALAMATIVEDFDSPPCKKQRKDLEELPGKTITSYFSPISKVVEKVLSPPRSNNIRDYFTKTSANEEHALRENKSSSFDLSCIGSDKKIETTLKSKTQQLTKGKKQDRRSNFKRKLNEAKEEQESVQDTDDATVDLCREGGQSSFLGSDTAALLAQICSEDLKENVEEQEPTDDCFDVFKTSVKRPGSVNNTTTKKDSRKSHKSENVNTSQTDFVEHVEVKSSEKGANSSTARKGLKKSQKSEKGKTCLKASIEERIDTKSDTETKQAQVKKVKSFTQVQQEGTFTDLSFEIPPDESSQLKDSTVVVSFEEFLKSHEETPVKKNTLEDLNENENHNYESANSNYDDNMSEQKNQEVSPRTLTVYAQVHAVPLTPSSEEKQKKVPRKIASIFLKKKDNVTEFAEKVQCHIKSSEKTENNHKRKSNVVIEEKELELAVLETTDQASAKPKCSQAEREEFMKAFKQPVGIKKGFGKQKDLNEKLLQDDVSQEDVDPSKLKKDVDNEMEVKTGKDAETNQEKALQMNGNKLRKGRRPPSNKNVEQNVEQNEDQVFKTKGNKLKRGRLVSMKNKAKQWPGKTRTPKTDGKSSGSDVESKEQQTEDLRTTRRLRTRKNKSTSPGSDSQLKDQETSNSLSTPELESKGPGLRRRLRQQKSLETPSSAESISKKQEGEILSPSNMAKDDPVQVSTPKMLLRSSTKHCMYKAEMISPPTEMESPIRMLFTRLSPEECKKVKAEREADAFTPKSLKKSRLLNRSKAKQLIEKAKDLQKNKSKSPGKTLVPLRRSSRQQALADRKSSEEVHIVDEDSGSDCKIVSVQQQKKKKKLRSINDVLGKSIDNAKNSAKDKKVASLYLGKKGSKSCASGPVSIFDESSQDGSENSCDDEQFKARREFLKSGLPESLKRQITKTAVAMEAYSVACMSFQPVTHVQQKDNDCIMWNLTWPTSSALQFLKEESNQLKNFTLSGSLREFCVLYTRPPVKDPLVKLFGWRPELSEAVKNCLAQEIQLANTSFPVTRILQQLWNRSERIAVPESKSGSQSIILSSPVAASEEKTSPGQENEQRTEAKRQNTKKRKRDQEVDIIEKKKALNTSDDSVIVIDPEESEHDKRRTRRSMKDLKSEVLVKGRLNRSSRRKNEAASSSCPEETDKDRNVPLNATSVKAVDDRLCGSEALEITDNSAYEDVLWTEKYQPLNSSELIGNATAIKKLHSWLKEWKRRAEKEQQKEKKKIENDKSKDVWNSDDFKGSSSEDEDEEFLCNTVLITGPTGVGKTAAVYACAKELGFKVFEVNASSQRSGRQILSQLKEATQSHQVSKKGSNAQKPSVFSNFSSSKSPGKTNSPRKVTSSPRKLPSSPRRTSQKKGLAPSSLASFFKAASKPKCKDDSDAKSQEKQTKDEAKKPLEVKANSSRQKDTKAAAKPEHSEGLSEESSRNSATSLILFEEVDVILEEDAGFLSAVKSFMATTKRPVVLTSSDTTFGLLFDANFEEIKFKTPSQVNVASYLQLLCLAENIRTDVKDFSTLLSVNNCDIRQSVLYLQFWARGGGGQQIEKPVPAISAKSEDNLSNSGTASGELHSKDVPKCDVGCTESFLGLGNFIQPSEDVLSFLKSHTTTTEGWSKWLQLFTAFQERQLDFAHSNLELLLPLPVCIVQETQPSVTVSVSEMASASLQKSSEHLVNSSPMKMSGRRRLHAKLEILADSDLFDSDSDSMDMGLLSIPASAVQSKDGNEENSRSLVKQEQEKTVFKNLPEKKPKTPAEQKCSALVYQSLDSLNEFIDNLSFLDCFMHTKADKGRHCQREEYNWTGAEMKDGLWDESNIEEHDWKITDIWREVRAAVEALSLRKCQSCISHSMETSLSACQALGKDPTEELTLHIPRYTNSALFSGMVTCNSSMAQKRVEIMKNVFCHRTHSGIWNMQAAAAEFLPVLRNICRSQQFKEKGKIKRRFLHYLEGIHLQLPKTTMDALAADFP